MTGALPVDLPGFPGWSASLAPVLSVWDVVAIPWLDLRSSDLCVVLTCRSVPLVSGPIHAYVIRSEGRWRAAFRPDVDRDPNRLRDSLHAAIVDAGLGQAPPGLVDAVVSALPDGSPLFDLVLVMGS